MIRATTILAAIALVFASALALVLHRHESRKAFVTLQELRKETEALNQEFGQLLLEQATWGEQGRVEELAREQLKMTAPQPEQS